MNLSLSSITQKTEMKLPQYRDANKVDLTQANKRNRCEINNLLRTVNPYLKHIKYSNRASLLVINRMLNRGAITKSCSRAIRFLRAHSQPP